MLLVLALAAAIWGLGRLMGASKQARAYMLGLLCVIVLALHVLLPDGHPVRMATGESPAPWLILGGFVAIALAYAFVLRRVKARADATQPEPPAPAARKDRFSGAELERYARHIVLRELGGPGQKALRARRARSC